MTSYIYLKNYSLDTIKTITQEYLNTNYPENTALTAEILMKNSRTYFIRFNEQLAQEEFIDWLNNFYQNVATNERQIILEAYQDIHQMEYKYYLVDDEFYAINSNQEVFKIEDYETLVSIPNPNIEFIKTEIPTKNIHSLAIISREKPKSKWWKIW